MTLPMTYRISGAGLAQDILADHYWRKDAKRIEDGGYIEAYNSSSLTVGTNGEMSIMLHFRLESCFGGHATTQAIARKTDGGVLTGAKGWSIYYDVATEELVVYLSDGTNYGELRAPLDQDVLSVWVVTYDPVTDVAILYQDGTQVDTLSLAGWSNANENTMNIKFGDATYGCSMMIGGFAMTSDVLSPGEVMLFNVYRDSEWDDDIDNQILHLAGEGYDDWTGLGTGVCDIDDSTLAWKDVTGNGHYTAPSTSGTQNNNRTARVMKKEIGHQFDSLSVSAQGSNLTIQVPWDESLYMGDIVHVQGVSNGWTGYVEGIEQGQKGKTLKCIGFDEGLDDLTAEDYSSYEDETDSKYKSHSDGVYEEESGDTSSGSDRFRGDRGLMLYQHSLLQGGMGNTYPRVMSSGVLKRVALSFEEHHYSLEEVKKSIKESASHVIIYFDTGVDVPTSDSFVISTSQSVFILTEMPTSITEITANGVPVERDAYTFNPDKKTVTFDTALTSAESPLIIKYQVKDIIVGEAFDFTVAREIGGMKTREYQMTGRPSQTDADAIASSYIHGPFHQLTIKPVARYGWPINWFVGRLIQINNTPDPQGINGDYKIAKLSWEGSINSMPKIELEETLTDIFYAEDLMKFWMKRNLRDARSTFGY